jgi:hypothetical protein
MRDYRDAKAMAHTLREALAEKDCKISVSESLELIAHLFGAADWNTLSAIIKNSERGSHPTPIVREPGPPFFSPDLEETLHRSLQVAAEQGQRQAGLEHLLLSLTQDPDAKAMMKALGFDVAGLRQWLANALASQSPNDGRDGNNPVPSEAFQRVVQSAILDSQASGERPITGAHVLLAVSTDQEPTVRIQGLDVAAARRFLRRRKT